MTPSQKNIYIAIRAEQIKYFQDTRNGHNMKRPYCIEHAKLIATKQLESDLSGGLIRISIEELLLETNEECIARIDKNIIEKAKKAA